MNFSLKGRIAASFIVATIVVCIMGFTVFFFLDSLNGEIEEITTHLNNENTLTDEVRISTINILRIQKKVINRKANQSDIDNLDSTCEGLQSQLLKLDSIYKNVELKKSIANMGGSVKSFRTVLTQTSLLGKNKNSLAIATISEMADNILDDFSLFIDKQFTLTKEKEENLKSLIYETKKNMLITLIITFFGTVLLALVVPGKIALPFKKITDAIKELQECNFDVSIYYNQKDEIGELAIEINKMILNIKKFEELRTDRISIELRKFDALANMVKKNVIVSNAHGEIIYMNNSLYSLLKLKSDDVLHKHYVDTLIPDSIKETYDVALKRRTKIENAEININNIVENEGDDEELQEGGSFEGFANVIPIRGKDSSLDYYLMILSKEVFV
jgi:nitrogen fixation/metabolism regulation signal transduction histidine kinase